MTLPIMYDSDEPEGRIIGLVQELAADWNAKLKLHETMLQMELRHVNDIRNAMSISLGMLVQAIADLGPHDDHDEEDQLYPDDHRQRA